MTYFQTPQAKQTPFSFFTTTEAQHVIVFYGDDVTAQSQYEDDKFYNVSVVETTRIGEPPGQPPVVFIERKNISNDKLTWGTGRPDQSVLQGLLKEAIDETKLAMKVQFDITKPGQLLDAIQESTKSKTPKLKDFQAFVLFHVKINQFGNGRLALFDGKICKTVMFEESRVDDVEQGTWVTCKKMLYNMPTRSVQMSLDAELRQTEPPTVFDIHEGLQTCDWSRSDGVIAHLIDHDREYPKAKPGSKRLSISDKFHLRIRALEEGKEEADCYRIWSEQVMFDISENNEGQRILLLTDKRRTQDNSAYYGTAALLLNNFLANKSLK